MAGRFATRNLASRLLGYGLTQRVIELFVPADHLIETKTLGHTIAVLFPERRAKACVACDLCDPIDETRAIVRGHNL